MNPPRRVFLSLGSNLGDRQARLRDAREGLVALPGTSLVATSRIYETAPREVEAQPLFLNQVVCLETLLSPSELLAAAHRLEAAAGRVRAARFGPRPLDIDILLVEGHESADPELTVPHPRMWERAFVLVPLAEVWSFARGMPNVDVPRLARDLSRRQAVEVVGSEAS
ncbi:MAG: 2-amino-4-hydroxy-6-hydroxymethyldihydropteridine diphosphokinase [Actinobacteria bacterium]|nr:2-amino-4-hydroxy-6-hydroxymethyldihydropteridine diphosphokinase [Actinomycetota bacterium]